MTIRRAPLSYAACKAEANAPGFLGSPTVMVFAIGAAETSAVVTMKAPTSKARGSRERVRELFMGGPQVPRMKSRSSIRRVSTYVDTRTVIDPDFNPGIISQTRAE